MRRQLQSCAQMVPYERVHRTVMLKAKAAQLPRRRLRFFNHEIGVRRNVELPMHEVRAM